MILQDIAIAAKKHFLDIYGAFHPEHGRPDADVQTLVLLGPLEPGFWAHFTASDEFLDGCPDPLDHWSARVIGDISKSLNSYAYFPFGGPPFQPFIAWAKASGRAHAAPVGLLVHDTAGLMVSYRGALGIKERLDLPQSPANPCKTCETKPCLRACPVDALTAEKYDVTACKADLKTPENDCMSRGCAVRRACPISQKYGRSEKQSAFHMEAFK